MGNLYKLYISKEHEKIFFGNFELSPPSILEFIKIKSVRVKQSSKVSFIDNPKRGNRPIIPTSLKFLKMFRIVRI